MKKSLLLLVAIAPIHIGCKKEKKQASSGVPSLKSFYLKIDGTVKNVSSTISQHTSGWILASGSTAPNETISLRIDDTVQTNMTYNFSANGPFRLFYTPDNFVNSYTSVSGSAHVASYDQTAKRIQGTYTCILVGNQSTPDTLTVTEGEFNITYP